MKSPEPERSSEPERELSRVAETVRRDRVETDLRDREDRAETAAETTGRVEAVEVHSA